MFHKYKYVLAVYQEQSFTKAAKKLFISQPSLSVAIHNIEKQIGGPLFERSGIGIRLTELGDAYIAAAQKMHLAEDEFERKCLEINGLQTGKLVVGGSNFLSSYILPQIITRFRERYPKVEITLVEANSVRLREMLRKEEVDLVIDNLEGEDNLYEKYALTDEHILLCVPEDRRINKKLKQFQISPESIYNDNGYAAHVPAVDVSLFGEEQFILLKNGNDMYYRSMEIFEKNNLVPNVTFQVDQLNISYALVESGMGMCFVTDTLFKYRKHTGKVVLYKLDAQYASRVLYVVCNKNRYFTRAMSEFIKIAQKIME